MRILAAIVPPALYLFAALFLAWTCAAHGSTPRDRIRAVLPVHHEDRGTAGKDAQLDAVADSVARHARRQRVAAFVIAWGIHESGFRMRIMAGRCRPLECDRGLARGSHQEHRNGRNQAEWDRLHGLENIDFQIESATRRARGMLAMCPTVEGAFRAMTGRGCSAPLKDARERARTFDRVLVRL